MNPKLNLPSALVGALVSTVALLSLSTHGIPMTALNTAVTVSRIEMPELTTDASQGGDVTRRSGGPIKTSLGSGIYVNENSSLKREWVAVHSPSLPADLVGTPGVDTEYESGGRYSSGGYKYSAKLKLVAAEELHAVEVRFLTFDVWGEHVRTLSLTRVQDIPVGETAMEAGWNLFSENECSEFYASIAYVARVRTKEGRVVAMPTETVLAEAQRFSSKFTTEDLETEEE